MSAGQTRRLSVPATDAGIKAALGALERLWAEQGLSRAVTWPVDVFAVPRRMMVLPCTAVGSAVVETVVTTISPTVALVPV